MAYPSTIDTFKTAVNNLKHNLAANVSIGATTIEVESTTGSPAAPGAFTIESEVIYYAGKTSTTYTGCSRGQDGTAAAEHLMDAVNQGEVQFRPVAFYVNDLATVVAALMTKVGVDGSAVVTSIDYLLKNSSSVDPGHLHSISGLNCVKDEDNMASDSDTHLSTQQSIKAYVDGLLTAGILEKTRPVILTPGGSYEPSSNAAERNTTTGTNVAYDTLDFDDATDESRFWRFMCPEGYDGGNIKVSIYYEMASATTNEVVWAVKTAGVAEGETIDSSLGSAQTFTADTVPDTAGKLGIASKSFDPGWAVDDMVFLELIRDADNGDDDASGDAKVQYVLIEYEVT